MKALKSTRLVTYRRSGKPALILEGKWLTERYRLKVGDVVDVDYQPKEICIRKNYKLTVERRKFLKEIAELRRQQIEAIRSKSYEK